MFAKTFQTATVFAKSSPVALSLRLRHKLNKQNDENKSLKLAADVVNYLESSPEYEGLIKQLPKSLLKKYKSPESMYLINKKTAKEIAKTIKRSLDKSPVVEVNPGVGILSEELLKVHSGPHFIYESSTHFTPHLSVSNFRSPNIIIYQKQLTIYIMQIFHATTFVAQWYTERFGFGWSGK